MHTKVIQDLKNEGASLTRYGGQELIRKQTHSFEHMIYVQKVGKSITI